MTFGLSKKASVFSPRAHDTAPCDASMRRSLKLAISAVAVLFVSLFPVAPAGAVNIKSFVSANGNDSNNCQFKTPCASMSHAVSQTTSGGMVSCLDSFNYTELVTISKSITIDCNGTTALAGPFVIDGFAIIVSIKNLTISTSGIASAISFNQGDTLIVKNADISGNKNGIVVKTTNESKLLVSDCTFRGNGTPSNHTGGAIVLETPSNSFVFATIERTHIESNVYGLWAGGGGAYGTVRDSVITGNSVWGAGATQTNTAWQLENTIVVGNGHGLVAQNHGGLLVSGSTINYNSTNLSATNGGLVGTYGDNFVSNGVTFSGMISKE